MALPPQFARAASFELGGRKFRAPGGVVPRHRAGADCDGCRGAAPRWRGLDPAARSTPIPLKGGGFPWAEATPRTRRLKLHLLYDPRQRRPVWFELTSAEIDDVVADRAISLEAGATYVFDKGYPDYRWWSEIIDARTVFVTRRKRNAHCRDIVEQPVRGEGILADRRLKIGHRQPRSGAPVKPLYQVELREIVVARPDDDEPLYLLTKDIERSAVDVARLYKQRWDIEISSAGILNCCSNGSSRTSRSTAFSAAAKTPGASRSTSR
jgi:Transposase DDE domain